MSQFNKPFLLIAVAVLTVIPVFANRAVFAQEPSSVISGEIDIDLSKNPKSANPAKVAQDRAIEYFDGFSQLVDRISTGGSGVPENIPDNVLNHLTAVYLYCSSKQGICGFVLDSILEVDIVRSHSSGKAECKNMKAFWKRWIANDMHKRIRYMVPIGLFNKRQEFLRTERPRFVKCDDTVKKTLEGAKPGSGFLKSRYAGDPSIVNSIKKTNLYLQDVKKKIANIFSFVERTR